MLKGEAYHGELLNREGVKKKSDVWPAFGYLWISCDFIRKEMAEAIPPDNSQLVCVGEVCCPKSVRKDARCASAIHPLYQSNPQTILQLTCF